MSSPISERTDFLSRWAGRDSFTVLQTGFGAGTLFLGTWAEWRRDSAAPRRLFFVAIEEQPLRVEDLAASHLQTPEWEALASSLRAQWPMLVRGIHRLEFDGGRVVLLLVFGPLADALTQLQAEVDVFLLPSGPCSFELRGLARLAVHGAVFAAEDLTPDAQTKLIRSGFALENRVAGAWWRGNFRAQKRCLSGFPHLQDAREALVIGAGLAGTAVAASLSGRGWGVTLLERHDAVAREASGNLAGVMSPMISRDDGLAARLSRASFLCLRRELEWLEQGNFPVRWESCGVLQFAKDAREELLFEQIAASQQFPIEFLRVLTREEASADLGLEAPMGGCLFPLGGWVNPPSLCEARLLAAPAIRRCFIRSALDFCREENLWVVRDAAGAVLGSAPVLILANAHEAARFGLARHLHFKKVRGQVSHLPAAALPSFSRVLCRDRYLTPALDGTCCLGATFDFDTEDSGLTPEGHLANLARLGGLLPSVELELDPVGLPGRVGFRALTADRMPMVGALPDASVEVSAHSTFRDIARLPGLYGVLGLGSRGLVWSALMGEFLSAMIEGEVWPIELDLAKAVDPARFLLKRELTRRRLREAGGVGPSLSISP